MTVAAPPSTHSMPLDRRSSSHRHRSVSVPPLPNKVLLRNSAMGGRGAVFLLCLVIGPFLAPASGQQSDILLKDVTVNLLEASGASAAQEKVSGPANLRLVLDHTRSLKVRARVE